MLLVHFVLIMGVAVNAAEFVIVRRIGVAVRTRVPFSSMTSGVDREIQLVMVEIRLPIVGSMAHDAIRRKSC